MTGQDVRYNADGHIGLGGRPTRADTLGGRRDGGRRGGGGPMRAWTHPRRPATTVSVAVSAVLATVLAGCAAAPTSGSENFPQREVRFVLPYSAGGPSDLGARALMECFEQRFGESWVVENQAGGAGAPAMVDVATAGPNGYLLGLGTQSTLVTTPTLEESVGYTSEDFTYIGQPMALPSLILVRQDSPFRTVDDLLAAARAAPDTISVGTSGAQTSFSMAVRELAGRGTVFNMLPFEGTSEANAALLGGTVDARWDAAGRDTLALLEAGRARPLATGSERRLTFLPEVPTLAERGVTDLIDTTTFYAMIGPRNLDPGIAERLRAALPGCVADPGYRNAVGAPYAVHEPADVLVDRLEGFGRRLREVVTGG